MEHFFEVRSHAYLFALVTFLTPKRHTNGCTCPQVSACIIVYFETLKVIACSSATQNGDSSSLQTIKRIFQHDW